MDRYEIINNYSKNKFSNFLENDYYGEILDLLNSEGLSILENSSLKKERIAYILTFSKWKNKIFKNEQFLDLFFRTDLSYYYGCLGSLQSDTYDIMIDKYINLSPNATEFAIFFNYFNKDYKLDKLKNWPYGIDVLYELINIANAEMISIILTKYNINLSDRRINISNLISVAKRSVLETQEYRNTTNEFKPAIYIPVHMIDRQFAKRLLETYDIFKLRSIINDLQYCTNPEEVNNYIKDKEDDFINNCAENILNFPYQRIFELFKIMNESKEYDDNYYTIRREYIGLVNNCNTENINVIIQGKYKESGMAAVYDYLKKLSDNEISNYIIDYNFEENYYNIMLDIRELLSFYYNGNVALQREHVELYEQISNIDYLSTEEKKQLHNALKQINIREIFYDDMSLARYIVRESIKEMSLTRDSIGKYKDEDLSKKYGVDVYVMNDEPFFGIVKTGRHATDELPVGHSYSLVGNDCVAVYGNVKDSNTFLYDAEDLNPDQIVHVFPFDSYTLFRPFNAINVATNRVNALMMPEEIIGLSSYNYSELLILERGGMETDIDRSIPELKRIALYCVDEIRKRDIEVAQKSGLGIILVKSKKYFENYEYYKDKYKRFVNVECEYFDGRFERNKFDSRR